ncbi:signal peptidase I [Candidatus Woesearchaeota archaeon]|nr:signal peptidase I [Candidatus Woesearchaeota archaeon]
MKYKGDFDKWWESMEKGYEKFNITYEQFRDFPLSNGFNKGDIIIIKGKKPEKIEIGDVIVFKADRPEPIIHRVVRKWEASGSAYFSTKGDMNSMQIGSEIEIHEQRVIGTAWIRVPYVGYVKIAFTNLLNTLRGK